MLTMMFPKKKRDATYAIICILKASLTTLQRIQNLDLRMQ